MRLELGRRADYAIRASIDLARHHAEGSRRKARQIAAHMGIPLTYVPQILAELVRAKLVASVAGPTGGYVLEASPDEISLLDVVRAVDGEPRATECVLRGGPCHWEDICAVHVPWFRAQQAMLGELDRTTLADVIAIDRDLDAGTFRLPEDVVPPPG